MASPPSPRAAREAIVLAVAIPIMAVNSAYAPGFSLTVGAASLSIESGDLAIVLVVLACLSVARREGWLPLRGAAMVLVPAALLALTVAVATLLGPHLTVDYPLATKVVSAAKFIEYAVLVVAVPMIVRRSNDAKVVVASVVATGVVATTWAVLQLIGLLPNFDHTPAGRRMPSFAGYHDFAILSGLTLAIAVGAIAFGHPRSQRFSVWIAAGAGAVGVIIAGALATVIALLAGLAFALAAMAVRRVLIRSRVVALVAVGLVILTGSAVMRSGDLADFAGFLDSGQKSEQTGVETYSQRTVLSYIGLRIFLDHPLTGVGWQGSELPANFEPYLADARRRFPEVTEESIPSAQHPWGVQNAYVQAAADMGVIGLVLIVWLVLAAIVRSARATISSRSACVSIALAVTIAALVSGFEWAAIGLVAGGPATAFIWLTMGAAVAVGRTRTVAPPSSG